MSVYVELFHGHHFPGEELDDWGFQGPILGPFPYFHITYGSDVTAPTTKVVGFLEPRPLLSPYGVASAAQQTPARV